MIFMSYKHKAALENGHSNGAATSSLPLHPMSSTNRLNGKAILPTEDMPIEPVSVTSPSEKIKNPWEVVKQSALDDRLDKQDGKIPRKKDQKMCRHGDKGMCDYCMPLEPFNASYLEEKKIKNLSLSVVHVFTESALW